MQPEEKPKKAALDAGTRESDSSKRVRKRDLSFVVGTWQEDPAFDEAIAAQDTVDEEMWR